MANKDCGVDGNIALMLDFLGFLSEIPCLQLPKSSQEDGNLSVPSKQQDAYYALLTKYQDGSQNVRVFFTNVRRQGLLLWLVNLYSEEVFDYKNLMNLLGSFSDEDFAVAVLDYYDIGNRFERAFYMRLIHDMPLLMNFLNGVCMTPETKWDLLTFLQNPEGSVSLLKQYLTKCYEEFCRVYEEFGSIQGRYTAESRTFEESEMTSLEDPESVSSAFQALTDGTRVRIIEILRKRECYNGELSRMLGVPMSSLSHHMEMLHRNQYVIKRAAGKRTYYKLNPDKFLKVSRILRAYADTAYPRLNGN